MSLRPVKRPTAVAWLCLAAVVGCSSVSVPGTVAPSTSAAVRAEVPRGHGEVGVEAAAGPVSRVGASSSAAGWGGPFGGADLWLGAGDAPSGLVRALGPADLPGPLLRFAAGWRDEVTDLCERPDWADGRAGSFGTPLPEWGMSARSRRRAEHDYVNCTMGRFEMEFKAPSLAPVRHGARVRHFWTREAADAWWGELVGAARQRMTELEELRGFVFSRGYVSTPGPPEWLEMRLAPVDAPLDELRVVPRSILVRDGVLRGLVRNWSRRLWAYETTVRVGGREFVWPLSVQPGEFAPFEIHDWRGPAQPDPSEFVVTAEMSWHVDPSRAFGGNTFNAGGFSNLEQQRVLVTGQGWDRYSDVWDDTQAGTMSVGAYTWDYIPLLVPTSHPSLAEDIETLSVRDLRGYGAKLDGDGRVLEVGPAFVGHISLVALEDADQEPDEWPEPVEWRYTEVTEIRDGEPSTVDLWYWVFEELPEWVYEELPEGARRTKRTKLIESYHDYDPLTGEYRRLVSHYGGFIVWIGAAHPTRTSE